MYCVLPIVVPAVALPGRLSFGRLWLTWGLVLALGVGLTGCWGWPATGIEAGLRSLGKAGNLSVDRITYVNAAGDVYTIRGDGTDRQTLTQGNRVDSGPTGPVMAQSLDFDSFHAWPTWSPGGEKLAVSRVRHSQSGRTAEVTIQLLDAVTGRSDTIYNNDHPGLVADGSPHYLYWSPDNRSLSFLASTRQGLGLFVLDTESGGPPVLVESGAPLYYSWSGEGSSLLVHLGDDLKLFRGPSGYLPGELLATVRGFRVPAFSPDGQWVAYVGQTGSGSALFVADVNNLGQPAQLVEVNDFSAFMWSPTGDELVIGDQSGRGVGFDRLRVVSAGGGAVISVANEPSIAFYWSPNGRRLAWVGLNRADRSFHWNVWNAATPQTAQAVENRNLMTFQPSRDVLTMLSYFDQYAYSHSPWSPDSSRLVVAGTETLPYERRNGHTPTGSRVFVIDAAGGAPPQEIAEGTLAFWSWN